MTKCRGLASPGGNRHFLARGSVVKLSPVAILSKPRSYRFVGSVRFCLSAANGWVGLLDLPIHRDPSGPTLQHRSSTALNQIIWFHFFFFCGLLLYFNQLQQIKPNQAADKHPSAVIISVLQLGSWCHGDDGGRRRRRRKKTALE